MLLCTTTEAYSPFFGGGDGVSPLVNDIKNYTGIKNVPKDIYVSRNIYLHGEIEKKAGFDIPIFLEGDYETDLTEGVHDCKVKIFDDEVNCLLYAWKLPMKTIGMEDGTSKPYLRINGLIITTDSEYKDYVESVYNEKPFHI